MLDDNDVDSVDWDNRRLKNASGSNKLIWSGDDIQVSSAEITGLSDPTTATSATTKSYVDNLFEGVKPKEACQLATTANITLSGNQTIDGILTVDGDRILVKDQTLSEENGIYIADSGAWSRSTDFDELTPINEIKGSVVGVAGGTDNEGKIFVCNSDPATLGTDPITFVYFNSIAALNAGDGIDITGTTISVQHDGEGLSFSTGNLVLELDGSTLSKSATGLKVATGGITNTEVNAAAAIAYSKLNLTSSIVNADVAAGAAIAYSKLNLSNSILDADINSAAAIALSKLAALTTSRALASDGSGVISVSATTSTELGYLSGVTGAIQTQLNGKEPTLPLTTIGDLLYRDGSNVTARLPIGTSNQVLKVVAGVPAWATESAFLSVSSINANTSAVSGTTYLVDTSGGAITVTLPAAANNAYVIVKDSTGNSNTNTLTVDTVDAGLIDGSASYSITSNYGSATFVSDGTNWSIL